MAERATDQITLTDLTDGISVTLSRDTYAFPGTTTAAIPASISTKIQALQGKDVVAATVSLASITKPTGISVTSDGNATTPTLTISIADTVTSAGEVVIPVVVGALTIEKRFSYSIAFKGATGSTGSSGTSATTVQQGVDAIAVPTDLSGATTSSITITVPFAGYVGTTRVAATVAVTNLPSGITVTSNTAATSSADGSFVLTIASGSTLGGPNSGSITTTYTANGLTFPKAISWVKAKQGTQGNPGDPGAAGASATTADLRNDAFVITTNSSGTTTAASNITIPFGALVGSNRVAATIALSGLPSGMTAGTNTAATSTADGSIVVSIASGSTLGGGDSGNFTASVTANGITFPLVVSWAKSKQGSTGATGTSATTSGLFNEAQMIPADASGLTLAAQTIPVNFFGYLGSSRIAVTATVGALPDGITVGTNTAGTTSADGVLTLSVAARSALGGAAYGTIPITLTANSISRTFTFSWAKSQQGSPGITLDVSSSNGLVFKNNQTSTTLTARVYQGGVEITGVALQALGDIRWYKDGTYLSGKDGPTLVLAAGDVTDKTSYSASLES